MEVAINNKDKSKQNFKKNLQKTMTLKKAPYSDYNYRIFSRSITNKMDLEKAHYEAELLLQEEEDNYQSLKKQNLKDNKYINILTNIYTKEKQK